jgi:hypothetical protein
MGCFFWTRSLRLKNNLITNDSHGIELLESDSTVRGFTYYKYFFLVIYYK